MSRADLPPLSPDMDLGARVPAGDRQGLHRHADARIILFLGGEMHEETLEGLARFARGDFVFRPAHFAHADIAGREGATYVRFKPSTGAVRRWVARYGWQAARGRVSLDRSLRCDDFFEAAICPAYQQSAPSTLAEKAAFLLAAQDAPKVQDVANTLCIEPYELTRRFLAEFKTTPSAYRRHARLQRAIKLLCEGAAHLAQVAHAAGYHDQSHLTQDLKREVGLTPGSLRGLFG